MKIKPETDWTLRGGMLWVDDRKELALQVSDISMPTEKKRYTKTEYLKVLAAGHYHGSLPKKLQTQLDKLTEGLTWYNPIPFVTFKELGLSAGDFPSLFKPKSN